MASSVVVFTFLTLLFGASALYEDFSNADDTAWQTRPITKVVGLLTDMQNELEREAKEDADMYENLACWCESNDKEKTQAIKDANQRIKDLGSSIESLTAKSGKLTIEIEKLGKDIVKNTDALDQATALRTKEKTQFEADEESMMSSAASLKGAVETLGSVHSGAAALPQQSLLQIRQVLKRNMRHTKLSQKQNSVVASLLQTDAETKYAPESGAIFGVLKQMKEGFEQNLASTQKEEAQAAESYSGLKAAKEKELAAAEGLKESKTIELANTEEELVQSKQGLEDTTAQLEADTKFLENLKGKCENADKQYEERQKVRGEEIEAVSQTMAILTEDESKDNFGKTMSFLQTSRRSTQADRRREEASKVLRKVGMKTVNSQLIKLAATVGGPTTGPLAAAVKQIDAMIAELKKIQVEESDQKKYCDASIKDNDKITYEKTNLKEDLDQSIADLTSAVETMTDEITELKKSVADTKVEIQKAGLTREKENKDFQTIVADQKATQAILQKAKDRMAAFYAKKGALLQTSGKQEPPAQKTYKKSAGASGVMAMLDTIIRESEMVEKKAVDGENDAQASYEEFITDANDSIAAASKEIMNKQDNIAQADKQKISDTEDLRTTIDELLKLGEISVELHQECDELIKNFNERQAKRATEIEGLQGAKAILSGAKI